MALLRGRYFFFLFVCENELQDNCFASGFVFRMRRRWKTVQCWMPKRTRRGGGCLQIDRQGLYPLRGCLQRRRYERRLPWKLPTVSASAVVGPASPPPRRCPTPVVIVAVPGREEATVSGVVFHNSADFLSFFRRRRARELGGDGVFCRFRRFSLRPSSGIVP